MLQPCPGNVGLAGFLSGTSGDHGNEEDLLTLGRQRCKDIPSGRAMAIGLWRLLRMISGCGRYRILCFSRCTLVDRVKFCISFACALKGLPPGRQALTLTLTSSQCFAYNIKSSAYLRKLAIVITCVVTWVAEIACGNVRGCKNEK